MGLKMQKLYDQKMNNTVMTKPDRFYFYSGGSNTESSKTEYNGLG